MHLETDVRVCQPFVGRKRQLAVLAHAFAGAAADRPAVVLVEGEAGIGKSRLLARATAELAPADAVVLRAVGDEAESVLEFGVLSQLVAGMSPLPAELAVLLDGSGVPSPLAAGTALLALLGELQDQGPVVLVVDDAHWSDSASLHALAFCLRRLRADRVLALLAARADELERLPRGLTGLALEPTGMTVPLAGLEAGEMAKLAAALGVGVLSPRAAERLTRHTGGSPLLAAALLEEFGASLLATPDALELHAPRSFASVVLARLARCAPRGRELAAAGSVLGLRWPLEVAAGLAGVDDPRAAADEAAAAGLIAVERGDGPPRGSFPHPLVRAALYQELTLARRAQLHEAAAVLADDPRDALRHRVEAEIGSNPELAAELLAVAERDAAAGSWSAAARGYLRAARVAPARAERERRMLHAAVCLLLAGDVGEARALVGSSEFLDGAPLRFARGYLAWTDGAFGRAEGELRAAWEQADADPDGDVAARAADLLSSLCVYLGRGAEGIEWAQRSLEAHLDELPGANPRTSLLVGYGISGRTAEGLAEATRLGVDREGSRPVDGVVGRGAVRLWADDPAGARADLRGLGETCLRRGPLDLGMFAAVHLADAEWRLGLWDDALLHAEAAVSTAAHAAHDWFIAQAHAAAALPLAGRGAWENAEAHVRGAVDAAARVGYGHGTLWAIVARARLAGARRDPERVVRTLAPLLRFTAADGVDHPGIHSWRELLGAALVTLGRIEEAAEHASTLDGQAERLELRSARAGSLRLRGLVEAAVGRHDAAIASFDGALAAHEALSLPFSRALVEADLGACLRRAGRRRAAADRLRQAHGILAKLGAAPYLRQVEDELGACGFHSTRDAVEARDLLTPAELSVARLVANGKSNRETAAELVLSVKTIEHHLGRIYQKLGISSRTQLALRLSEH